jgi:hypothetical protein
MLSNKYSYGKRRIWVFPLLLFLASLIFSAVPAPAVGATELKAELVKKTMEGTTVGIMTGQVQLTYPDGHIWFGEVKGLMATNLPVFQKTA